MRQRKRWISLLLVFVMLFSMVGCHANEKKQTNADPTQQETTSGTEITQASLENHQAEEALIWTVLWYVDDAIMLLESRQQLEALAARKQIQVLLGAPTADNWYQMGKYIQYHIRRAQILPN